MTLPKSVNRSCASASHALCHAPYMAMEIPESSNIKPISGNAHIWKYCGSLIIRVVVVTRVTLAIELCPWRSYIDPWCYQYQAHIWYENLQIMCVPQSVTPHVTLTHMEIPDVIPYMGMPIYGHIVPVWWRVPLNSVFVPFLPIYGDPWSSILCL